MGIQFFKKYTAITDTGTNITLNNTASARLLDIELKGKTSQEQLSGKNLLNIFGENAFSYGLGVYNTTVSQNGTIVTTANFASGRNKGTLINNLEQNTDYTVSLIIDSIVTTSTQKYIEVEVLAYNADNTYNSIIFQQSFNTVGSTIQKTFNSGTFDKIAIHISGFFLSASDTGTVTYHNLMVEEGSTATSYEPYCGGIPSPNPQYPQAIKNVTGNANVKIQNKNLYNKDNDTLNYYYNAQLEYTYSEGTNISDYIQVKENENMILSYQQNDSSLAIIRINFFNEEKTLQSQITNSASSVGLQNKTFQVPSGIKYVRFSYYSVYIDNTKIQLEQGTTATSYVPHQEQNLPLTLGNIELCKIGNYQDYFYKENNKWYLHKVFQKYNLGNATYASVNDTEAAREQGLFVTFSIQDVVKYDYMNIPDMLCNNYVIRRALEYFNTGRNPDDFSMSSYNGNSTYLQNSSFSGYTNAQVKEAMAGAYLYYPLKTPTDTEITDTTLIEQLDAIKNARAYADKTIISSTSDELGFDMKVTAYKEISKMKQFI